MRLYDRLELLGPRVLVRPLPDLGFTPSGLVKPDSARNEQNRGIVEKAGPGRLERDAVIPIDLGVGDLVFYQRYAGTWVTLDDHERLMLMEDEVQARIVAAHVTPVVHTRDEAAALQARVRALDPTSQLSLTETEHLEGEPCLICFELATIAEREQAAKAAWEALAQERAALVASRSGS